MEEAKERSRAVGKKGGERGLKFEAEATGWLQKNGVPLSVRALGTLPPDFLSPFLAL